MAKTLAPTSASNKKEYLRRLGNAKYAGSSVVGKPYEISCSSKTAPYGETARTVVDLPDQAVLLEESYSTEG